MLGQRIEGSAFTTRRVAAIDAVRGLVMIIMALDHVRDFIHRAAMTSSPTDLASTTPLLFFTRWITHICAPAFVFTAGLGAFFWFQRGKSKAQLSKFLLTRGLWLVVLELTVMRLAYNFNLSPKYPVFLLVLWVLGISMIGLALLVWLPMRLLAVVSVAVIVLHNLLDNVTAVQFGAAAGVWNLLHQVGPFRFAGTMFIVAYPLIPWIAVMSLGFCFGPLFLGERAPRRRHLAIVGVAVTLGFVILRALNGYGDPAPWTPQSSATFTALSFLNTSKYPPSLAFLLMTLGPALLLLAWFERPSLKDSNPLVVFGRVPLFYFVFHFYAAHAAAVLLASIHYWRDALPFLLEPVPSMGGPRELFPQQFGYDLWVVYVIWALIVLALYPACRWFARVKATRRDWWLSYL